MSKVILLVEDNPTDEKLTILAFKKSCPDCAVAVVRDGAEALDYLFATGKYEGRDTTEMPALTLLDLELPRIGGLEVLRRIRAGERTRLLPVLILTSSKEDEDLLKGYTLGANAYVRKPVEFADLAETAKAIGVFWLSMNQRAPIPSVSR